jgi:hypothetical protein
MATIVTTGIVTPGLTATSTTEDIPVGTKVSLSDGGEAIYVQAISEVSQYAAVSIYVDNTANMATTTTAVTTKRIGFADSVSIPSGSYAWVRLSGRPVVNLAANCADQVPLFTTATGGVLDDATVSGNFIQGVESTVTISNATAITCIVPNGAMIDVTPTGA